METSFDINQDTRKTNLILSQIFTKTLNPLRIIGSVPIIFKELTSEENLSYSKHTQKFENLNSHYTQYKFHFKWISLQAIYSFFIQLAFVLATAFIIFNVVSGHAKVSHYVISNSDDQTVKSSPAENTSSEQTTVESFGEATSAFYVTQGYSSASATLLTSFWTVPYFVALLNKWTSQFAVQFYSAFPNYRCNTLSQRYFEFYRKLKCRLKCFLWVLVPFSISYSYLITNCLEFRNNPKCSRADYWVSIVSIPFAAIVLILNNTTILMIVVLIQVVIVAQIQIKKALVNAQSLQMELCWKQVFKLVTFVRRQYKLVEKVCGPIQLVWLTSYFASAITNWIIVLWLLKGKMSASMVQISLGLSLIESFNFWILIFMNERVLKEEKEIVQLIVTTTADSTKIKERTLEAACKKLDVNLTYYLFY